MTLFLQANILTTLQAVDRPAVCNALGAMEGMRRTTGLTRTLVISPVRRCPPWQASPGLPGDPVDAGQHGAVPTEPGLAKQLPAAIDLATRRQQPLTEPMMKGHAMTDLTRRLIRYADLRPCRNAFVDTRSPGSEAKENFTLIGLGVSENPNQHVHIPEPHGFNIGAARQPGHCLNSQHSHETAEVFIIHNGHWRFKWGPDGKDGYIDLSEGDVISLPIDMFRGFENLGMPQDVNFAFAILGGDDPGKVTWSPPVFELARRFGMVLLDGGKLIDTTAGETVPAGAQLQAPPDAATLARLASPSSEQMAQGVVRFKDLKPNPASPLAGPGVEECPVIVPRATRDHFKPGPITGWWPHGFNLRCLKMASGAHVPAHVRHEEEVLLVHSGTLEVTLPDGQVVMGAGDTFTTPKGHARSFRATSSDGCVAYVVRGGDEAGAVAFVRAKAA